MAVAIRQVFGAGDDRFAGVLNADEDFRARAAGRDSVARKRLQNLGGSAFVLPRGLDPDGGQIQNIGLGRIAGFGVRNVGQRSLGARTYERQTVQRSDCIGVESTLTECAIHEQPSPAVRQRIREQAMQSLKGLQRTRLQARLKLQANRGRVDAETEEPGVPLEVCVIVTEPVAQPSQQHRLGGVESVEMDAQFVHVLLR